MTRRAAYVTGLAAGALLLSGAAAGSASAAPLLDPPYTIAFTSTDYTFEYGEYWFLEAHSPEGSIAFNEFSSEGTLTGAPSGYTPVVDAYHPDTFSETAYMAPSVTGHSLPAGAYTATLTIRAFDGAGDPATTPDPAHLTITPAALGIALQVIADPSNPANAIVSARFTGHFVDETFFSTSDPASPQTPAGSWRIVVEDADGQSAHELTADRSEDDDVMAVSSYWSDVPPGEYTARATFTPSGASADNFTITDASPVAYTAAAPPGSGSTAPPAPPAPPATNEVGMTLPLWIPIAAGVLSAGLLALMIVQIVRLRRAGLPATAKATS